MTISTLLKNIKLLNADSILSSNTEGVGRTTSCMYCTLWVWCILFNNSGLVINMTSLNLKISVIISLISRHNYFSGISTLKRFLNDVYGICE